MLGDFPLNDCERVERVFVIISPRRYLSIDQWVGCPESTSEGMTYEGRGTAM